MDINTAHLIREVKKGCTYRRIAEMYYPEGDPGHGNQGYGDELCFEAFQVLYPNLGHPNLLDQEMFDEKFKQDNKSHIGAYYWWE